MISSLRGRAAHVDTDSLVVEVGGVGLAVAVTPHVAHATNVGDEIHLHTNLIVREDALSLFGFESRDKLIVFTQLLSVTGVGPKSALGVLAALSVAQIAEAVAADDDAPFRRVSGIGPKTAKLIVVQLAGKIDAPPRGRHHRRRRAVRSGRPGHSGARGTGLERTRRDRGGRLRRRGGHTVRACDRPGPAAPHTRDPGDPPGRSPPVDDLRDADEPVDETELAIEGALRPSSLAEFVGQQKVRGQLQLLLDAARNPAATRRPHPPFRPARPRQDDPRDDRRAREQPSAAHVERPGHPARRRPRRAPFQPHSGRRSSSSTKCTGGALGGEEMLYLAMEDFRIDIMVGKGAGATSIPLDLSPFTLVGATTRSGLLPNPLRDRFGFTAHLEYLRTRRARAGHRTIRHHARRGSAARIARGDRPPLAGHTAHRQPPPAPRAGLHDRARRRRRHRDGRRRPRPLRRRRDRAGPAGPRGARCARASIRRRPRRARDASRRRRRGGRTIESVVEPYLVRIGFIGRTPRGRIAMPAAFAHLGDAHVDSALRIDDL